VPLPACLPPSVVEVVGVFRLLVLVVGDEQPLATALTQTATATNEASLFNFMISSCSSVDAREAFQQVAVQTSLSCAAHANYARVTAARHPRRIIRSSDCEQSVARAR